MERRRERAASEKWRNKANPSLALLSWQQAVNVDAFGFLYTKQSQFRADSTGHGEAIRRDLSRLQRTLRLGGAAGKLTVGGGMAESYTGQKVQNKANLVFR